VKRLFEAVWCGGALSRSSPAAVGELVSDMVCLHSLRLRRRLRLLLLRRRRR